MWILLQWDSSKDWNDVITTIKKRFIPHKTADEKHPP